MRNSVTVRATILAAAVPSLASLVLTAWSLMDSLPAPWAVGLAAGVVLDVALVSAVAIAWINPQVAKPAQLAGWLVAALAAGLVGWHSAMIAWPLVALGLIPLAAKGLWGLALHARLARRDADAELDTGLTHAQQASVAERHRDAAYSRALAEADRDVEDAKAEAAHEQKLATIRRAAEQRMAMDREDAKVALQRQDLIREVQAGRGIALESGEELPLADASLMGFGSAMGGRPRELEPRLRELLDYVAEAGEDASVRDAARALGCDAATVRRRRAALAEQGYDVSALTRTQQ